ncbi:MAG: DNA methyltransferase, partial [Planctomycetota bacterium]|nr:DNA methyltransferase [Planctomycetota bacterium]
KEDKEVDELDLDDEWTTFFKSIGGYDFRYEVNVDVLGHLFEKSINDIERIRLGGLFDSKVEDEILPKMAKSAERKKGGIYYTPPKFTEFITNHTVAKVADEKLTDIARRCGIDLEDPDLSKHDGKVVQYSVDAIDALRQIKIIDPACGSGAFLIQAYDVLDEKYLDVVDILAFHDTNEVEKLREQIPDFILHDNLFGVDLSPEAVEITQLALWLRSAQKGKSLADLSHNIICGNSLVSDPEIDPNATDWEKTFPEIFSRQERGFDCVIGNPPWERIKLQEREFFDAIVPSIATAVNAATRRKLIAKLQKAKPDLHKRYIEAKTSAEKTLAHVRKSGKFPLTGKGDINTYSVFAELAYRIVAPNGLVGLLVPTGIATEHTTRQFFRSLVDSKSLYGLYDFENLAPIFPDVHRSYKFCVFLFTGTQRKTDCSDFVFFAHKMEDLKDNDRHISLSSDDFKLLNPNTRTCPIFRSRRDANLTNAIYKRVPVLKDKNRKEGGNPWGIKFIRMFDQTNDAELFHVADQLKAAGFKRDGALWKRGKKTLLPLYEAKMFRPYDHRFASVYVKPENWMIQGQTTETTLVEHQNPEFSVESRWWAEQSEVSKKLDLSNIHALIAFRNITRATDARTVLACFIPKAGVINSAPTILFEWDVSLRLQCCLLANLNSFVLDYVAKQKIAHINLNFFIVEQFPIFSPDSYSKHCPWDKRQTLKKWISERVLKLTCTSNDMKPMAEAANLRPPVHKWNPTERLDLQAQLDAAFFLLYGLKQPDVEYILSTFSGVRKDHENMFDGSSTLDRILGHYEILRQAAHAD